VTNPDLARTLELIAAGGADVVYRGVLAKEIVAAAAAAVNPRTRRGGRLSLADLAAYRAVLRPPVCLRVCARACLRARRLG
jgi:gamma-glutamyltranspeptidase/glutathione hydrolase